MSSHRTFEFPDPVGPRTVYRTNHDETYFLPMGIPTLRQASFNIYIDPAWVDAAATLRKLGLLRAEPLDVRGVPVSPLAFIAAALPNPMGLADRIRGYACFVVEVTGEKAGRSAKVRMWSGLSYEDAFRLHGTNATGYLVGTGGAVATEMLLEGQVRAEGLVIPEQLDPEAYLSRLREKGIEVHEEVTYL